MIRKNKRALTSISALFPHVHCGGASNLFSFILDRYYILHLLRVWSIMLVWTFFALIPQPWSALFNDNVVWMKHKPDETRGTLPGTSLSWRHFMDTYYQDQVGHWHIITRDKHHYRPPDSGYSIWEKFAIMQSGCRKYLGRDGMVIILTMHFVL